MNIKSFIIPITAVVIGFTAGYLSKRSKIVVSEPIVSDTAVAKLEQGCKTCYPATCAEPFDGVPIGLAKDMLINYKANHLAAINANCSTVNSGGDSRSVWFSLEKIKRFVFEIESKVCNSCGTLAQPELGVRIYFGEYPEAPTQGINAEYAGLHTLIMVPTYWDGLFDRDFDPAYIDKNCRPIPMDSVGAILTALAPGENASMRNHGSLYRPPYAQFVSQGKMSNCTGATFMYYVDGTVCEQ